MRLPDYGIGIFLNAPTKSALKKAIKKERITVNDDIATSATLIRGGETIQYIATDNTLPKKVLNFDLRVLFEDEHIAAVHKPPGIVVSGNKFKTIANALPQNITRSTLPDASIPQSVHRLDYATSGILLIGKTHSSIRKLNRMFENKEIEKTYYAITMGKMENSGQINRAVDGKKAQTKYTVSQSVSSERFGCLNLVLLNPLSGRRHQLRQHMAYLGNPILGDKDYGIENLILNGKGMYLHAYSLQFEHPFTDKKTYIHDELPEKFTKIFDSIN